MPLLYMIKVLFSFQHTLGLRTLVIYYLPRFEQKSSNNFYCCLTYQHVLLLLLGIYTYTYYECIFVYHACEREVEREGEAATSASWIFSSQAISIPGISDLDQLISILESDHAFLESKVFGFRSKSVSVFLLPNKLS